MHLRLLPLELTTRSQTGGRASKTVRSKAEPWNEGNVLDIRREPGLAPTANGTNFPF